MLDNSRRAFSLGEAIPILERTPHTIDAILRGLPDAWLLCNEGPDTFSPYDVVGHLIHGEKTDWMPRVRMILQSGDQHAFEPFDRFAQREASRRASLDELLDEFARLRAANIAALQTLKLTSVDLDRRGKHPELGTVTMRQLLATWVAHDLDHVIQIARVMGRQYTDEVGPWTAHLRIISGTQG
ncbi:MAG TPA: DinB family protein [Candidatus Eisenbacteria bacterium]|nr:DinB family protein [Candidatus Eisenbacteria bacterium]